MVLIKGSVSCNKTITPLIDKLPVELVRTILCYLLPVCDTCHQLVGHYYPPEKPVTTTKCSCPHCHTYRHHRSIVFEVGRWRIALASSCVTNNKDLRTCHTCGNWYCPTHQTQLSQCSVGRVHSSKPCHHTYHCDDCMGPCTCGNAGCTGKLCVTCYHKYHTYFNQ